MTVIISITITSLHYIIIKVPNSTYDVLNESLLKVSHEEFEIG